MSRILVLYATVDGQAARIAAEVARVLREEGHHADVHSARAPGSLEGYDGIVVGAAIRYGHYPAYVVRLVRGERERLNAQATAFFSVCLSADGPGARPATAQGYVDKFLRRTGWRPAQVASFGGALLYRHYNPVIRTILRVIVGIAGGDTDTSREYEYTDWNAVAAFAREFAQRVAPAREPVILQIA